VAFIRSAWIGSSQTRTSRIEREARTIAPDEVTRDWIRDEDPEAHAEAIQCLFDGGAARSTSTPGRLTSARSSTSTARKVLPSLKPH